MGAAFLLMRPCPSHIPDASWVSGGSLGGFLWVTESNQIQVTRLGTARSPTLHWENLADCWPFIQHICQLFAGDSMSTAMQRKAKTILSKRQTLLTPSMDQLRHSLGQMDGSQVQGDVCLF